MKKHDSTVLVTGGLGYIGSHVTHDLLARGWRVRILDNYYRCDRAVAASLAKLDDVEVIEGDVRYANAVESAMQGVEAVVHLAAVCINKSVSDPTESLDVNLLGTQNVFDSAARNSVHRIVYSSSASVYGNPTSLPMRETDKPAPITPYCTAKLAGEHLLSFYAERSKLSWLALRFFNVYGPGQPTDAYYTSVVLTFLRRLAAGDAPIIDGRGEQSMDFVHVTDVARSVGMALDSTATGEVLNVGTGTQTTVAQLADQLIKAVGADVQPVFRPREVLVTQREASIERIRELLGWEPTIGLEEGLASVVHHLKTTGELG
ncbi:NAD-dependent epimerase/dehydratase family protein [Catellatospora paridis]|uniref:NAD-dependent epimerase/dehydratase family protein n=1 Tax=Catellatospora paridis TaxID=1617086 RepID=UPI0012D3FC86|nr:NAD-dependent epimerase/dehydratase family protein [Catellatospora paridis]